MNYLQLPNGILPHLARLSGVQVAIWADAWTWEQQGAQAYRTNAQLAEMLGVTVKSVSCAITNLRNGGYLEWTMVNGRQRILKATIPSNVHPPVERKASRSTSIPSNVKAASRPTSTLHPVKLPCSIPSNFHQVDNRVEQVVNQVVEQGSDSDATFVEAEIVEDLRPAETLDQTPVKSVPAGGGGRKKKERVFHEVVLPWDTDTFKDIWREWLDYKWVQHRFVFKRQQDEQSALHNLQKFSSNDERIAKHIIVTSITNGWQGLFERSAKSYVGPGARSGSYLRPSGEYANPSDVIKDRSIWG